MDGTAEAPAAAAPQAKVSVFGRMAAEAQEKAPPFDLEQQILLQLCVPCLCARVAPDGAEPLPCQKKQKNDRARNGADQRQVVEMQGKCTVLVTKTVETKGKCSVLVAVQSPRCGFAELVVAERVAVAGAAAAGADLHVHSVAW